MAHSDSFVVVEVVVGASGVEHVAVVEVASAAAREVGVVLGAVLIHACEGFLEEGVH